MYKYNYKFDIEVVDGITFYNITFPDFGGTVTCTTDKSKIYQYAKENLTLTIYDYITTGKQLPKATAIGNNCIVTDSDFANIKEVG